jgi:hypothetical protein
MQVSQIVFLTAMLISPSLIKIALLFSVCFSANAALRTTLKSSGLDIQVPENAFGTVSSRDITALLRSAAEEILRSCPQAQLPGIDVYHRTDHPQTDFKRARNGRITIGLTAQDTHWAQFAFQFGHEFCHALANDSDNRQRSERYPPRANFWLEESLCETASLFTLRAMSRSWQTAPPYPSWRNYAPWLNAYAAERIALPEHRLPKGKSFSVWFKEKESALRRNAMTREWNTVIAIRLLPLFEAEPRGWEAVTFLNDGVNEANNSLAEHFAEWRTQCPANLGPFVSRLEAVFVE